MKQIFKSKLGVHATESILLINFLFLWFGKISAQRFDLPSLQEKRKYDRNILDKLVSSNRDLAVFKGKKFFFTYYELDSSANISGVLRYKRNDSFSLDVFIAEYMLLMPTTKIDREDRKINFIERGQDGLKLSYFKYGKYCADSSSDVFILNCRSLSKASVPIVFGYYRGSKVVIVDKEFRIYSGLSNYIKSYYGSIEKYKRLLIQDSILNVETRNLTIQRCQNLYKQHYKNYYWDNKLDSIGIIDRYMAQVDSFALLIDTQNVVIRRALFPNNSFNYKGFSDTSFHNISRGILKLVLNPKQLERFYLYDEVDTRLSNIIWNRLSKYYFRMNKNDLSDVDRYFIKIFPLGSLDSPPLFPATD